MTNKIYIYVIIGLLILITIQSISLLLTIYDKSLYETIFSQVAKTTREYKPPNWLNDSSRPGTHIKKTNSTPQNFRPFTGQGRTLA
jgi:hypothetical protein